MLKGLNGILPCIGSGGSSTEPGVSESDTYEGFDDFDSESYETADEFDSENAETPDVFDYERPNSPDVYEPTAQIAAAACSSSAEQVHQITESDTVTSREIITDAKQQG